MNLAKLVRLAASLTLVFIVTLAAQTPAPAPAPTAFDAASIKPSAPQPGTRIMMGIRNTPGRLTAQNMPLKDLIQAAYGLKPYQVVGPDWLSSEHFDISAETPAAMPREQMNALLQPFLVEQFKLVTHRETKIMPIYALVVDKDGPKFKPAAGPKGGFMMQLSPKGASLSGTASMDGLATLLARQTDRPVIDMTGLKDTYDLKLDFTPDGGMLRMEGGMRAGARTPSESQSGGGDSVAAAPTLFTALQEQLGLKLEARKGPVEILVVDHAEKAPVGN